MVLVRRDLGGEARRLLAGRLYLRHPLSRDYADWARLRGLSRAFLTPWEPAWRPDELSRASYREKLRRYHEDAREGRGYALFSFRQEDDALVGGVTLSQVRRGAAQSGTLGYWVGQPFRRQGYTREAGFAVVEFAFEELGLHRLEASCLPENAPSRGVLQQLGFKLEGRARGYLRIDGEWRDHDLFGLLRQDVARRGGHG